MYVDRRGLIFLWINILLHNIGEALKSCHTRSNRCTPGPEIGTVSKTFFRCPKRGHFPIANDTFTFYKCPGREFLPCTCTCKNSQMCFDSVKRRCRFAFLESVKNCTYQHHNEKANWRAEGLSTGEVTKLKDGKQVKHRKASPEINEVLKPGLPGPEKPSTSSTTNITAGISLSEPEVVAAQQSANMAPPKVIEDDSRFPAWAISLLVLCVVLVLVFIVMVMY